MEEIRSTDILDKEIEADARKKAERVLQNTDAECQKLLDAVDGRVKTVTEQKAALYKEKIEAFTRDSEAALPLEKERFLVSFNAKSVAEAFNAYLVSLGAGKRLSLVKNMLEKAKPVIAGKKMNASVFGFDSGAAKKMLEGELGNNLLSCKEIPFEKSGEEPAAGNTVHEGIILESEDSFVRCRLTIDQLVSELEDTYSYELASTLFGGRLPE